MDRVNGGIIDHAPVVCGGGRCHALPAPDDFPSPIEPAGIDVTDGRLPPWTTGLDESSIKSIPSKPFPNVCITRFAFTRG